MTATACKQPPAQNTSAFKTGLDAEAQAVDALRAQGFEILAQRYRTPHGEIDVIACRERLIVFVEVKARRLIDDAAYAITRRQQRRIIAAATAWLQAATITHPDYAGYDLRFDAMLVAKGGTPKHLPAAFDASD